VPAIAAADNVPRFNIEPVCRGASQGNFGLSLGLQSNRDPQLAYNSCVRGEMASRGKLVKRWATFKASDRANCTAEATAGGLPSYTDLLTCLQMSKDAAKISQ